MLLGYNTNGLAHHRWDEAIVLIAEAGYRSVALTVDHHCLAPLSPTLRDDVAKLKRLLDQYQLHCVIETGARFLLDPRRKHQPTLLSATNEDRACRLQFLNYCIDLAAEVSADAISFWSGTPRDPADADVLWSRLRAGCAALLKEAERQQVRLAFEPEPGMFLETCDQYARLHDQLRHPLFGLTLDVGHVHCLQDGDIADRIRQFAPHLFNLHIEDMQPGVHEHLRFGQGSMKFPPILQALREVDYSYGVHVELSRHSHMAPEMLQESFRFLSSCAAEV
ncbi:TIM barrel protein [bacterium]|nr:TIM barrel protein [bacterium]